ncbi:MAG: transporter substrate-binding domain-containing protein [Campylobacteraceae bacterium]|nr:transporter substrate-binding domain-containing protein [Campylobacteraceae bacterium]
MRKILIFLAIFIGISSLADDVSLWEKSTLNQIIQRGELIVGIEPDYIPFVMRDKRGSIIGFDVDMANEMAKAMGVKLTLVPTSLDKIIPGLLAKEYDIIMSGMAITQKRNLEINFTDSYISMSQTILIDGKHGNKTWKDLDSPEYTIATKIGSTGEATALKMFKKANLRTFETADGGTQELLIGGVDAFIYDRPYNAIFISEKGAGRLIHLDDNFTYEPLGWGVRKGDPDFLNWLNNFLLQTKGDGRYVTIYNRWFGSDIWLNRVL